MAKCDFPECDLTDYFCRMSAGPMDYTPGAMRNFAVKEYNPSHSQPGSQGTRVHQLAMFTMFESPLQMLCDSPSLYRANKDCFSFITAVPTVWDETKGLAGKIGDYAVVARRKGETWYVGAMGDWQARTVSLDTAFLGSGEWTAIVVEDGVNADRDATDHVHRTMRIKAGDKLEIKMAPGGGWTARFVR
jgi:alpha-glucosidase